MEFRSKMTVVTAVLCLGVATTPACNSSSESSSTDDSGMHDALSPDSTADSDGVSSSDATDTDRYADWPDVETDECGAYTSKGPHPVGMIDLEIDGSDVTVWYPATENAPDGNSRASYDIRNWLPEDEQEKIPDDKSPEWTMDAYRDVPASGDGPFPLVLFSHGFAGYRMQSSFLTVHLASWGHVVASADHPGRTLAAVLNNDLSSDDGAPETMKTVRDTLQRRSDQGDGRLAGLVEASKTAVTGHSAGAGSALTYAANEAEAALVGYAGRAGDQSAPIELDSDVYLMAGTNDQIVSADQTESTWEDIADPKRYLAIADAGHLAFSDICLIGRDRGGLLEIADRHGVDVPSFLKSIGQDGCREDDLPPELAWPLIKHFTTAHLRAAFGRDASPVDLDEATYQCFGELVGSWREDRP